LAVSRDGRFLISSASHHNSSIELRDLSKGALLSEFADKSQIHSPIVVSGNGQFAVSAEWISRDKITVSLWRLQDGSRIASCEGHTGRVNSVAICPGNQYAASGSHDGSIRLWELQSGKAAGVLLGHDDVQCVDFTPDGTRMISGALNDGFRLWDFHRRVEIRRFSDPRISVTDLDVAPNGRTVAAGHWDHVALWDMETGTVIWKGDGVDGHVESVAFSPDGRFVVCGDSNHYVSVLDVTSGNRIARGEHQAAVTSVAFTPDGRYCLSSATDDTIRYWSVPI